VHVFLSNGVYVLPKAAKKRAHGGSYLLNIAGS